jgi:predicted transcriptional regulator
MATAPSPSSSTLNRKISEKWGPDLAAAGWTALPNVIFQRQRAFGLDSLDLNILLHLAGYWWTPGQDAHPSKQTLANAIGVDPRTIQRRIAAMEAGGLIKRVRRTQQSGGDNSNAYSFAPLIEKAKPYAREAVEERAQRKREALARSTRKKPQTPLTVISGKKK